MSIVQIWVICYAHLPDQKQVFKIFCDLTLGVSIIGVFWSLRPEPGQQLGSRLVKRNVETPLVFRFYLLLGHINPRQFLKESFMATNTVSECTCQRWYLKPGVKRVPVEDGELKGTLFIPKGMLNLYSLCENCLFEFHGRARF